jgi:AcrR family transcriptional regulator
MTWDKGEYFPRQKRAREKKGRLIKAALEEFSRRGYNRTSAKRIAAGAQVATGTFYRYFRDKKAVFMAVCRSVETEIGVIIFERGQEMRKRGVLETEILKSLIKTSVDAHHANKKFHREVMAMQLQDQEVASWVRERESRTLNSLKDFLEPMREHYRPRDLETAAELILHTVEETAHRAVLFDSASGEDELVRELSDMIVRYMFD